MLKSPETGEYQIVQAVLQVARNMPSPSDIIFALDVEKNMTRTLTEPQITEARLKLNYLYTNEPPHLALVTFLQSSH